MSAYSDLTAIARSEGGTGSKACIARGFGSASGTYDSASRLQKAMGDTMLACIPGSLKPANILDLGCGTGWFTRKLANQYLNAAVIGADLAPGMLQQAKARSPETIGWLNADAEQLPLADNSADLIFSNLMIQWSTRPETVLAECKRILKPGGTLAISTLLDGTLEELKQAWTKADPGQPHVNRFTHHADWQQLTSRQLPGSTLETATLTLPYDSPMALNRELKHLGAVFKGEERRRTVTAPGRFKAMCAAYPTLENGEIIASYHAGWLYWSKPI
ncbi:malonyl-ACP O-methyltransferase BioC [Marinobacter sp. G11]|uniref:malonyl-ACP O-methyltransferase BioC n=1 Tax=Marinobacter sp. G11 TaxID=2903522 RepID=UPI001E2AFFD6|nr:malonyl-ACP O-methyltransferase BioC [Marinobacter sp. G11]MCE0758809.1 malonyl-ACP O-methyltransferase BioC [Marinobacter sp. G11]